MSLKELVAGGVITLVIGGGAYTVNQSDVINNFAEDTGMTQQQAETYVNQISDEELVPYEELGQDYIDDGQEMISYASSIDCYNYTYDWESPYLSCYQGKQQIDQIGRNEIALGKSYQVLGSDNASRIDISTTILHIDRVIADHNLEIVSQLYSYSDLEDSKNTNHYNKALLETALESE